MSLCLAIDQGTTGTKAYRWRPGADVEAAGALTHRQICPQPGWVEHDPRELLRHVQTLIHQTPQADVVALANQGETVVMWDAQTREPLANAIVWQDQRTEPAIARLRREGAEVETRTRAGLPLDAYFSASKMNWLLDNVPGAREAARQGRVRLGTSDSYFLDCLTGEFVTDMATASRTSLMNIRTGEWDSTLCGIFDIPSGCLPEIRSCVGHFGKLPSGASVRVSVVDQQAALYGHECTSDGEIKITFGTGAFVLGVTGEEPVIRADTGLLPTVAWQVGGKTTYALDGGILCAGSAIEWGRTLGVIDDLCPDWGDEPRMAERGLFFVPALSGLGAPSWNRAVRGTWSGMDLTTDRRALALSIWEGVALRARQVLGAFTLASGHEPSVLSVDGGMTRSAGFRQFLADVLARPIRYVEHGDLTAMGLLRLCATSLDENSMPPVCWRTVLPSRPLAPSALMAFDHLTAGLERMAGEDVAGA